MNFSKNTQKLIDEYEIWNKSLKEEKIGTIHADEVALKVASFYEKIRGIIDWKEEHLLRRNSVERALKRRIFANIDIINGEINDKTIEAESLILELIRGGHFPNDTIKEEKIKEVQNTIDKYIFIFRKHKEEKLRFFNWMFSIASCEIEEILTPSPKEIALIDYMFSEMKNKIKLNEGITKANPITEEEKYIQIYIAVQRALFNLDSPIISYYLLKYKYKNWNNLQEEELKNIANKIYEIKNNLNNHLNHPLGDKFYNICQKYNTVYLIIGDILNYNFFDTKELIKSPENLESLIKKVYKKRLETLKSRMNRAAIYSTLSIFLTNIVTLLAIEIPLTKLVGVFNPISVVIDIFVPTLLMAFLVITINPPPKENLNVVLSETIKVFYKREKEDIYEIKTFKKRSPFLDAIVDTIYSVIFIFIIIIIGYLLYKVNFPPFSSIIFVIFIALIAFAGAKIRERAKELHMVEERENFGIVIFESVSAPIVHLGKWLSLKWERYNIISIFFSALIDMPFMVFIEFIEQWRYFIKEKKEKIH